MHRERFIDREQFDFEPVFGGTLLRWARKVATRWQWKTRPRYDADDLMQEGYLIFHKLATRYHTENAAHFGALFRLSFVRRLIDLAKERSAHDERAAGSGSGHSLAAPDLLETVLVDESAFDDLLVSMMLDDAPDWIHKLIRAVAREADRPRFLEVSSDGERETTNQKARRILGWRQPIDVQKLVRAFVLGENLCLP